MGAGNMIVYYLLKIFNGWEDSRASTTKVVKIATLFSSFVSKEENVGLME
jgi:hypothetical protein